MTVKQRLIEFLKHENLGQKRFAQLVGLSDGYVNAIRVSIQPETLRKISMRFPDLNTGWLLTGEGSMLKSSESELNEGHAAYERATYDDAGYYREQCDRLMRIIENNSILLLKQQEEIERLRVFLLGKEQASIAPKVDADCAAAG